MQNQNIQQPLKEEIKRAWFSSASPEKDKKGQERDRDRQNRRQMTSKPRQKTASRVGVKKVGAKTGMDTLNLVPMQQFT